MTNTLTLIITAYCHCAQCCTVAGKPTASGVMPSVGVSVAGPRWIPFGTQVWIPSVGWRTVHDRTSRKYDGRVDIFMSSHKKAKKFGKRVETVILINKTNNSLVSN